MFFNNVAYAVSDNIAFTDGFSMIPSVSISNQLYFFTGKVGFEVADGHYLGGGLGAASANTFEDALIIGYANYTHSFHRGSLTGGLQLYQLMRRLVHMLSISVEIIALFNEYRSLPKILFFLKPETSLFSHTDSGLWAKI